MDIDGAVSVAAMMEWFDSAHFGVELRAWSIRGALCALPSFIWALVGGFVSVASVVAMLLGVCLFVVAFAGTSSSPPVRATAKGRRALSALQKAAWLKIAWTASAVVLGPVTFFRPPPLIHAFLTSGLFVDMLTGGWIVDALGHSKASSGTFLETVAATSLQGTAITVQLAVLAFGVLAYRRLHS